MKTASDQHAVVGPFCPLDPFAPLSAAAVRGLQEAEGHRPCFQTDLRLICQTARCRWRAGCRHLVAEWLR